MEHYDWNEGWLFTPRFDPALVRPECGLELEPVRIPHTVRVLPYNYCNENEYQCLCGYRREFFAPREWAGRTVLLTFGAVAHSGTARLPRTARCGSRSGWSFRPAHGPADRQSRGGSAVR